MWLQRGGPQTLLCGLMSAIHFKRIFKKDFLNFDLMLMISPPSGLQGIIQCFC